MSLDFSGLDARLLPHAQSFLSEWFPAGRVIGHEFCIGDIHGSEGESLKFNLNTGVFKDFADDTVGGNGLIALYAATNACSMGDAFKRLSNGAGVDALPSKPKPASKAKSPAITPLPDGLTAPREVSIRSADAKTWDQYEPSNTWWYRDGIVCRVDRPDGSKEIVPHVWTDKGWRQGAMPEPRVLYGRELFEPSFGVRPILVVEGEKAADAARKLCQGYIVVTWAGGASAWRKTDWSPLAGRKVLLWPDADEPGRKAMQGIAGILTAAEIKIIDPRDVVEGWDAADAVADGWTWNTFKEWAVPRITVFTRGESNGKESTTGIRDSGRNDRSDEQPTSTGTVGALGALGKGIRGDGGEDGNGRVHEAGEKNGGRNTEGNDNGTDRIEHDTGRKARNDVDGRTGTVAVARSSAADRDPAPPHHSPPPHPDHAALPLDRDATDQSDGAATAAAIPEVPAWLDDVPPIEYDMPLGDADPPHFRYPGVWLDDTTVNLNSEYLIKGVINYGDYVVVYGPSGDGKTFFTIDLALHIAAGMQWRGKRVKQFMVVYVAAEAGHSIERRFAAARDAKLAESNNTPLIYLPRGPNLMDEVESAELLADLVTLKDIALQRGTRLGMVVFDTVARSMAGGDENSAQDMGRVVEMGNRIRDETGAATLVVHHTGKDPAKGMRGSSAIFAASDCVISVIQKIATVEKSKDGSSGISYPFSLKVVELGKDNDGEAISTCVVETSDQPMIRRAKEPTGRNQKVVFDVLREMVVQDGQAMPGTSSIPEGARAVSVAALINRCVSKFPGIPDWRSRERIGQAITSLQASENVGVQSDYIWIW